VLAIQNLNKSNVLPAQYIHVSCTDAKQAIISLYNNNQLNVSLRSED
jgi:hypothetical protein